MRRKNGTDGLDIARLSDYAEKVVLKARRLWQQLMPEARPRFQKILFPCGFTYAEKEGLGTDETCLFLTPSKAGGMQGGGVAPHSPVDWNRIGGWLRALADLQAGLRV